MPLQSSPTTKTDRPSHSRLPFIPDHAQEGVALFGVTRSFDTLGREAVDDSQDTAALLAFGDDGLGGIGGGAKNRAHFGYVLNGAEDVDGVAFAHHDHEGVAGGDGRSE